MTAPDSLPLHALTEDNLATASPDLLRAMVKTFTDALMSAEADAMRNAEYGQVSEERVNHRNGYRPREWDTRAQVPQPRHLTPHLICWSCHSNAHTRRHPSPGNRIASVLRSEARPGPDRAPLRVPRNPRPRPARRAPSRPAPS